MLALPAAAGKRRQAAVYRGLVAELDLYKDQHQRNLNRLEALLSRHWPEAGVILDLDAVSLQALLAHYGDPVSVSANAEAAFRGSGLAIKHCVIARPRHSF